VRQARILVVDDEPGMVHAVERILARRHQVTGSFSAAEAMNIVRTWDPDLAILDIRMPEIDGFELTARLKALNPYLDVILMTGSMSNPDQKLIRAIRENAFYFIQKPFDSEVLRTLVDRCLELKRLADENRAHVARLEGELAEAQLFQRSLLPEMAGQVEGLRLEGRYEPCTELGGDFFDYAAAGPGRVALLIADVSGHGVSASMLTGIVKSAFRSCHAEEYRPAAVMERIRNAIQAFEADRFITVIGAVIDVRRRRLVYVNAGHPEGLVFGPKRDLLLLEPTGPIISPAFPEFTWDTVSVDFGPDDRLLLYTDGITEARGPEGFFGDDRLHEVVARHPEGGGPLLDAILAAVREHSRERPQPDDLTMVTAGG